MPAHYKNPYFQTHDCPVDNPVMCVIGSQCLLQDSHSVAIFTIGNGWDLNVCTLHVLTAVGAADVSVMSLQHVQSDGGVHRTICSSFGGTRPHYGLLFVPNNTHLHYQILACEDDRYWISERDRILMQFERFPESTKRVSIRGFPILSKFMYPIHQIQSRYSLHSRQVFRMSEYIGTLSTCSAFIHAHLSYVTLVSSSSTERYFRAPRMFGQPYLA